MSGVQVKFLAFSYVATHWIPILCIQGYIDIERLLLLEEIVEDFID